MRSCWHTPPVSVAHTTLPDFDRLDAAGLKALVLVQHDELLATHARLLSREREMEHLKLLLAQLRRMQFGRKSEKLERQIEQLELKLEELESTKATNASESASASSWKPPSPHTF